MSLKKLWRRLFPGRYVDLGKAYLFKSKGMKPCFIFT